MKDILRVDRKRLIRFWINRRAKPSDVPVWHEIGHFFAGFDFKLTRVVEEDGRKREIAGLGDTSLGYLASGTFEYAQNTLADTSDVLTLMQGPCGIAMLFGSPLWPTKGKLLVIDWMKDGQTYIDRRLAVVGDPLAYNTQIKEPGKITGWTPGFSLYTVDGAGSTGPKLKAIDTLFTESGTTGGSIDLSKISQGVS